MNHTEFYNRVVESNEPLESLFDALSNRDFIALKTFLEESRDRDFSFSKENGPKTEQGKPLITESTKERLGAIILMIEKHKDYSPEGLKEAFDYLASIKDQQEKETNGSPAEV